MTYLIIALCLYFLIGSVLFFLLTCSEYRVPFLMGFLIGIAWLPIIVVNLLATLWSVISGKNSYR